MDNRKKKDVLIIVMLVAVVCMSVAFATLSRKLEVVGTNAVKGKWQVEITDIDATASQGMGVSESVDSDLTVANVSTGLYQPGDSVTYSVVVENKGNIDAKLASIASTVTPNTGADDNPYIIYTYDGITSGSILEAGDKITFTVTVQYSSEATLVSNITANLTTILNYVQNA